MTEKLSEDNPDHKDTGRRNPPKEDKGGRTAAIPSISDILAEDHIEVKGITDRPAPKKKRQSTGAPTGNQPQRRTRRSPAPPRPNRDEQGGLQTLRKFQEFEKLDPKNADFLGSIITPK